MVTVERKRSDGGFTLTELLVVMMLMGLILSIAYGLFDITRSGTAISNREAWTSREVAVPLDFAERMLSQQIRFDYAGAGTNQWRCAFFTQRGGSAGGQQRYVIEVPSDPDDHRLLITVDHGAGGAPTAWSEANFNRAVGEPLFRYLDFEGNPIDPPLDATSLSTARAVIVTIVTEHEGREFRDSRTIFFRNR